ncbi:MAG: S8 family serine peptidase, partial [Acidimicrobiia bacterium]|nr:S8 family serine peptidase [Acidimicrobiia bacterium]
MSLESSAKSAGGSRKSRAFAVVLATALVASTFGAAPALAKKKDQPALDLSPGITQQTFDMWESAGNPLGFEGGTVLETYGGSMYWINRLTGAGGYWFQGITGAGVDIALIDTGIAPVPALSGSGKIINGPDLSFDSQSPGLEYVDLFGHGTHLAGIIAGHQPGAEIDRFNKTEFLGMAPGARLVNMKVADGVGAVDVSQVIAAIDWVVEHKNDNGMNIRVITLAYGTDGVQAYDIDPLAHAVERAWHEGIVVVVAAGNDGLGTALRNPATDPYVITVGATENAGIWGRMADDVIAPFSSCGTNARHVDVLAPGKSIVSLRNPGSMADTQNPEARIGSEYFVGSGTSQAAAVVAGAVALILEERPELSPDQVKQLLMDNSRSVGASANCEGAGSVNLRWVRKDDSPTVGASDQTHTVATGTGSLEAARGSMHVWSRPEPDADPVALTGEVDIMGMPWTGYSCNGNDCASLWNGGDFNGAVWSGASWSGASWSGASWSGASWSGASWSGASWSGASWSGTGWMGAVWG